MLKNTIAPPQDETEGFAITEEMRKPQVTMNRMRKYQMLANKNLQNGEEGTNLHNKLEGKVALNYLKEIEIQMDAMRTKLNNERTQRWRNWVDNSWGHKEKDIYKWIRGKRKRSLNSQSWWKCADEGYNEIGRRNMGRIMGS